MPTVIKSIFICISLWHISVQACDLKEPLVSLSGPLTMVLEELDLLQSKKLKAISTFHPIAKKTNARMIAGGVFLSKKELATFKNSLVYYDKSFELKKLFESAKLEAYSISSVGKDSFAFSSEVINVVASLTEGCEEKVSLLKKKIGKIQNSLLTEFNHKKIIFFVGEITTKLPELVMVHDGPMLFLKEHELVKTYPSELAYVNWSQREIKKMKDFLQIGLADGKGDKLVKEHLKEQKWNLKYRGVFIPGIRQVFFLRDLSRLSF